MAQYKQNQLKKPKGQKKLGQSLPQDLEVSLRSGLYFLVTVKMIKHTLTTAGRFHFHMTVMMNERESVSKTDISKLPQKPCALKFCI